MKLPPMILIGTSTRNFDMNLWSSKNETSTCTINLWVLGWAWLIN